MKLITYLILPPLTYSVWIAILLKIFNVEWYSSKYWLILIGSWTSAVLLHWLFSWLDKWALNKPRVDSINNRTAVYCNYPKCTKLVGYYIHYCEEHRNSKGSE